VGDGGQEILIQRIALAIALRLFVHRAAEAAALLVRIRQLAEPIGEFDAAGIDLEPFGHARIGRLDPRQRRLRSRIFEQQRQTVPAQMGFDVLDQDLAENIRPGVVATIRNLLLCRCCQRCAIALAVVDGRKQVDAGKTARMPRQR